MSTLRAAVVQDAPVPFDVEATLRRVETRAREAAGWGARLAVFPEAFLGGYPKGLDFGARVGSRSPEGRRLFERYAAAAVDVPGPATQRLGALARETGLHLVVGAVEREGGTLYCSALFVGADGTLLGKRRKVMPTAVERLIWGFGDGSTLGVFGTPIGRLGGAICWENYMPLLRTALYAQGIELWAAPTVDDRESWLATMRHVAMEGRCFVLSASQCARRRDVPGGVESAPDEDPDALVIRGGSCVVSPLGEVLAGPLFDQPGILLAELDMGAVARGKMDLDVVGHYARPDLFRLHVDTREQRSVTVAPDDPEPPEPPAGRRDGRRRPGPAPGAPPAGGSA